MPLFARIADVYRGSAKLAPLQQRLCWFYHTNFVRAIWPDCLSRCARPRAPPPRPAVTQDHDAFEVFIEAGGPYDKGVAKRLHDDIMAVGNGVDPTQAYRNFRGSDPKIDRLLRARGFWAARKPSQASVIQAER